MAEPVAPRTPDEQEQLPGSAAEAAKGFRAIGRSLLRHWLAVLIGLSVVVHGVGFLYYRLARSASVAPLPAEVDLGVFKFEPDQNEGGHVVHAKFSLAIALLDDIAAAAHQRLRSHEFRVRQQIEQLLRQAHSGDFDDPTLGGLKRRLQEQINSTLGVRAIAEVIITDLQLQHSYRETAPVADTARNTPWLEKPSG